MILRRRVPDILIIAFAAVGLAMMGYLTWLHYAPGASSVCDLGEGFSCQVVNQSVFSEILGIPLALLGAGYFAVAAVLAAVARIRKRHVALVVFSAFSLVFSLYLSGIEVFMLDSICVFCEASKVMMVAILAVAAVEVHRKKERHHLLTLVAVLLAAVFAFAAFRLQGAELFRKDYSALTGCLADKGVTFYGAYWCPACAKQKKILGPAFAQVKEIECDPRAEGAETELCVSRDIIKTPTWIEEPGGVEKRRLVGSQSAERLAEFFGCPSE